VFPMEKMTSKPAHLKRLKVKEVIVAMGTFEQEMKMQRDHRWFVVVQKKKKRQSPSIEKVTSKEKGRESMVLEGPYR